MSPASLIPQGTVLTAALLGNDEQQSLPPGTAQIVLAVDQSGSFVEAGDLIEIWGSTETCQEAFCEIEKLCGDATVVSKLAGVERAIGTSEATLVTMTLPSADVGSVLRASQTESIHFVLR